MLSRTSMLAIVSFLSLVPAVARADCGCGAAPADAPCTQATLATVPATKTFAQPTTEGLELAMTSCLDCGGPRDLLPLLALPLLLFVFATAIQWLVARGAGLMRLRAAYSATRGARDAWSPLPATAGRGSG